MKIWLLVLMGCCGCLDSALPEADVDMGQVEADMDQELGITSCEKLDSGQKIVDLGEGPTQVWCLNDYGGGWLLVGRSGRTSEIGSFGWLASQGRLDDDSRAYSLGAELEFTEILVVAGDVGDVVSEDFAEVARIQLGSKDFITEASFRSIGNFRSSSLKGFSSIAKNTNGATYKSPLIFSTYPSDLNL